MISMNIRQLIKAASAEHTSIAEILQAIKIRMKSHPTEINEKGLLDLTPCHAAVLENQAHILEILVLVGNADLDLTDAHGNKPEDLSNTDITLQTLNELRKEVKRRTNKSVFHLHDYIHMLGNNTDIPHLIIELIQKRIASFPQEVNEKTYWGRTACHWAMFYGLTDILPMLLKEGNADLSLKDLSNQTPMDLLENVYQSKVSLPVSSGTARKISKDEYAAVFSTLDEKKIDTKEVSVNYISDSLAQLKIHHEEHDAKSIKGRDRYALEPLKLNEGLVQYSLAQPRRNKRETLLDCYPVCDEIKNDNVEYVRKYLQEGNLASETIPAMEMPLVHYAFVHANKKVFRFLLSEGIKFSPFINAQSENVIEANISYKANKALRFLIEVRNSFINNVNIKELRKSQQALKQLEKVFQIELIKMGLTSKIPASKFNNVTLPTLGTIAKKHNLTLELLKTISDICSCLNNPEKPDDSSRQFEPVIVSQMIMALATIYPASAITLALNELSPFFSQEQKLIAYFILKELVLHNNSDVDITNKYFHQVSVPFFTHSKENEHFSCLNKHISEIQALKNNAQLPMLEAYYQLDNLISHNLTYKDDSSFLDPNRVKTPKQLAHELKALTLQFYHVVDINEFVDMRWQKKGNDVTAPHLLQHQIMFDKISSLIKHEILTATSKNERVKVITLWAETLKELLDNPMPDYNSAMIIFCSLNHASVSRLNSTFDAVGKEAKSIIATAEEILSPTRNFANLRTLVKENPHALPFTGIFLRDITYAYENKSMRERLLVLGPIFSDFKECQNRFKMVHIPLQTDLPFQVMHLSHSSDESLYHRSIRLEPPMLSIVSNFDAKAFTKLLNIYVENGQKLVVETSQGIEEGEMAFKALFAFLLDKTQQGAVAFKDADEILKLAHKTLSTHDHYQLNPLYFLKKNNVARRLTLQFDNKTKNNNQATVLPVSQNKIEKKLSLE